MAESKLLLFEEDQDHYLKAYQIFVSYSAKNERQEAWTNTVLLDKIVPHLPNLDQEKELRVLGIGSGSGEVDYSFLTALLKKYPIISNRVVDPAEDQIFKYKALAQSKAHELQGVKFDWRQQTLAQYRDTDEDGTRFHFISAINSMYYAGDVDSSLMYMYDLLEPGGIMLLILTTDQSAIMRFWRHMPGFWKRPSVISSADMRSSFDCRNIPYIQSRYSSDVDITQCFDETSEDGHLLLDFLFQVNEFKKTATASQYKEMIEYLASSECSRKDGSKILMSNDWDAVIVTKLSD